MMRPRNMLLATLASFLLSVALCLGVIGLAKWLRSDAAVDVILVLKKRL